MSDLFIGSKIQSLDIGEAVQKISRVNVVVDSDNMYTAGDDTGRTVEVECPWGSQSMADILLGKVSGYEYKPYSGEKAILDPAFEIGDTVTVGGLYSVLAYADTIFNSACLSSISAPEGDEIDDEYPIAATKNSNIKRQLAQTRSLISKTAEEILLEVSATDGRVSALSVTLDGVTIKDETGQTLIKGSSIDTSTIKANSITADKLNITGSISFGDLDSSIQSKINTANTNASNAITAASSASSQVSAWTYSGSTLIDGSKIMTGTVMASYLQGGIIDVKGSDGAIYGIMYAGTNTANTTAFEIHGSSGLRLSTGSGGNIWMECGGTNGVNARINLTGQNAYIGPTVYLTNGTLIASDRELKHDIEYDLDAYDVIFDNLKPARFKYNDGTSGRYHTALIAQDVKEAVLAAELTTHDFAGYCEVPVYEKDENGNPTGNITGYTCALRYDEFMALAIRQIQMLKARVAELERRLAQ